MKPTVDEMATADYINTTIRESLASHVGTNDLDAVKRQLGQTLKNLSDQNVISGGDKGYKVGKVTRLWTDWSLKKKIKWLFYNKTPVIRELSRKLRTAIEDHNSLIAQIEHAVDLNEPEVLENFSYSYKELPEHLIASPKGIIVSDIEIKLAQNIDFVSVNLEIQSDV